MYHLHALHLFTDDCLYTVIRYETDTADLKSDHNTFSGTLVTLMANGI